ncbi:hypothetical protein [Bdellovibrio sp.]|uniref:hypothetical protein n=1 Tax=Bdellovibrio TaxID=958 RepID=UPI00322220A6
MKKMFLLILTSFAIAGTAGAMETYSSAQDLPESASVEPLWNSQFERPSCPKGYVVAKKYCWSKSSHCFEHCGYICSKIPKPNDPSERH